jgi:hypothetical protein
MLCYSDVIDVLYRHTRLTPFMLRPARCQIRCAILQTNKRSKMSREDQAYFTE